MYVCTHRERSYSQYLADGVNHQSRILGEREGEKKESAKVVRDITFWEGKGIISPVLKVPSQCPLVDSTAYFDM